MKINVINLVFLLIPVFAVSVTVEAKKYITHCRPKVVALLELRTDGGESDYHQKSECVRMVEKRLRELSYNPGKVDGKPDTHLECAIMGFQRMNGMQHNFRIDTQVIAALEDPVQPKALHAHDGLYAEADLSRQILTLYSNGEIVRIMPVSSGSGKTCKVAGEDTHVAITPTGDFIFFTHIWGLHESHLGDLFNPVYFDEGDYAVHGDRFVPPHPASHGCLRITIEDSKWFVKRSPARHADSRFRNGSSYFTSLVSIFHKPE